MEYTYHYMSPLGKMTMSAEDNVLTGLWFDRQKYFGSTLSETQEERQEKKQPVFEQTCCWLDIYFSGEIPDFLPKMKLKGSEFRKQVWDILLTIPYGQTMTYGQIADMIAKQKGIERMSAQAVGGAVGHNPVSIIIPCHRVLGVDRSLTGYAGGIDKKIQLLQIEKIHYKICKKP